MTLFWNLKFKEHELVLHISSLASVSNKLLLGKKQTLETDSSHSSEVTLISDTQASLEQNNYL